MTKRQAHGRRRADVPRTTSLEAISQAVASNAGSVGRQAAVVAAASGLIVTLGVPGQATAPRDVSAAPVDTINPERVAVKAVSVAADKDASIEIERASFTAEEKEEPVVVAVANEVTATSASSSTSTSSSASNDSLAPTTRSNVNSSNSSSSSSSTSSSSSSASTESSSTSSSVDTASLSGIAATAVKYAGVPYVWGGASPSGWDCSGFVKYVYAQNGINVARGTSALLSSGQFKRTSNPKPGDLVFQNGGGHVGIYLGNGQMIGAQNPSVGTIVHSVSRNPLYGYYTYVG